MSALAADDLRQAVVVEARSWLRTPYHHCAAVKGPQGGVDCAMLLLAVHQAVGAVPLHVDPRPYAPDWHMHRSAELFLSWLDQYAQRVPDLPDARADAGLQPADVLCWRYGRTYSHGAIHIGGGQIIHALRPAGQVCLGTVFEADLLARPRRVYRLKDLIA